MEAPKYPGLLSLSWSFDTTFTRLFSFISLSPTLRLHSLILSFSLSYLTHHLTFLIFHSLSFFSNVLVIIMMSDRIQKGASYLIVRRRLILLSQFKGDLSAHQFVRQLLDHLLDRNELAVRICDPTTQSHS